MRALVVDDEALVRSDLVHALARVAPDFEVREAQSAQEALALLNRLPCDVVFLDIRMPGLSGLDAVAVIDQLPRRPPVVFVTAYADHALKAFEFAALDYLLKPVTEQRLAATLKRVRAHAYDKTVEPSMVERLPVDVEGRTLLVRIDEIRYVQARGHLVTVALFDQDFRFRGSLLECSQRLEAHGVLRVHRAYLVNPRHVVELNPFLAGTYSLHVDDRKHSSIPVSRNFVPAVRAAFQL